MNEYKKQALRALNKEQLVDLIDKLDRSQFLIGETCVDVSKWHISPEQGIDKIRGYLYQVPSLCDLDKLIGCREVSEIELDS